MSKEYAWIRIRKSTKDKLDTWAEICDKSLIDMLDEIVDSYRDAILVSHMNRLFANPDIDELVEIGEEVAKSIAKRDKNE